MKASGQVNLSFLDTLSCTLGAMLVLFFIFVVLSQEGLPELSDPVDARAAGQIPLISEADEKPIADELPWLYEYSIIRPADPSNCRVSSMDSIRVTSVRGPMDDHRYIAVIHTPSKASGGRVELSGCQGARLKITPLNHIAKAPSEQVVSDKLSSNDMRLNFSTESGREVWEIRNEG